MTRRLSLIVVLLVFMLAPFLIQVGQWAPTLDTPRVNQQRLALASDAPTRLGETVEWPIEAEMAGLERIEIFARASAWPWWGDQTWVEIEGPSGELIFSQFVTHRQLWDDVMTLSFSPQSDSEGSTYWVRLRPAFDNRGTLVLAIDANDEDQWIHQPYYATDIDGSLGLFIVVMERLRWRLLPLVLFTLLLVGLVLKKGIPLHKAT